MRVQSVGFARSGRDFIMSCAGWLIMNRWLTVPEAPALHVLWRDGDDAGAIKRAVKAREGGGDILTTDSVTDALAPAKVRDNDHLCGRL